MAALKRLTALYPLGHSVVARKVDEVFDAAGELLNGRSSFTVEMLRGEVHLDGVHLADVVLPPAIVEEFAQLRTDSLRFQAGLNRAELLAAAAFLNVIADNADSQTVEARLAARDVRHVAFRRLVQVDTRLDGLRWSNEPPRPLDPAYAAALERTEGTFEAAQSGHTMDAGTIRAVVQLLIADVARSNAALAQILAIKQYENLTYCHSVNVAVLSLLLGRQIGLRDETLTRLVEVALLHDIGKTRIPLELLQKPGALDPSERKQIERHTTLGAELLLETPGLDPLAPVIALEHHRWWKGGGYPDLGDDVAPHVMSQIVTVADIFEALTGARSYRQPMQPEHACLALAREAGTKLNPAFVKAFVSAVTFFPVGSWVRTDRGDVAIVIATNGRDPMHPIVRLVNSDLDVIGDVDTSVRDEAGSYRIRIVETLPPQCPAADFQRLIARSRAA
jgi:putative nucleotidyltransferase with HDIG domain